MGFETIIAAIIIGTYYVANRPKRHSLITGMIPSWQWPGVLWLPKQWLTFFKKNPTISPKL